MLVFKDYILCLNFLIIKNGSCPDYVKICTANTPFPLRRNYELTIDPKNPVLKLQESDDKVLAKVNLKLLRELFGQLFFHLIVFFSFQINLSEFKTKAITFGFNIKMYVHCFSVYFLL